MEKKMITLGSEVFVTDPCYTVGTWCQTKLTNVLPGRYYAFMTGTFQMYGERNTGVAVIHEDYITKQPKPWYQHGHIGVDSGQAGIFSAESYKNDSLVESMNPPNIDFVIPGDKEPGDLWYETICKFTLGDVSWGVYDQGIVSSSGMGDGEYSFSVQKAKGKIIAIAIDFGITDTQKKFFETLEEAY
jgi:hypothetical protein